MDNRFPMTRNRSTALSVPARKRPAASRRPSSLPQRARVYWQLMRMHKPIGALLLLWPTLWALWLAADGFPRWDALVRFVLGVVVMRSAGCGIHVLSDSRGDGAW